MASARPATAARGTGDSVKGATSRTDGATVGGVLGPRLLTGLGHLVAAATIGLFAAALVIDRTGDSPNLDELGLAGGAVVYGLVGLLVVRRHPRHRIAWILLTIGIAGTLGGSAEQVTEAVHADGRSLPGAAWAGWVGEWYWVVWLWAQFVFLPLLFPTGELPTPRWRRFHRVAIAFALVTTFVGMFGRRVLLTGPQIGGGEDVGLVVDNPVGFLPIENLESAPYNLWLFAFFALTFLSLAAVIRRFRRATGEERAQIKVAVYGIGVTIVCFVLFGLMDALGLPSWQAEGLLVLVIPVSLGVAVLRFRLYDIDRLISRTVAYVVATAVLVGIYLGSVVVSQAVLRPVAGESDLAVAASTLVAAALFRPVLGRVQAGVDRRFHRRRYDAQLTVEVFGHRLRDDVDLGALLADLRATVVEVVEPRQVAVWVPASAGESR